MSVKKLFVIISGLLVLLIMINFSLVPIQASNEVDQIDLSTTPESQLFKIENMKPGDWLTRELVIRNNSNESLNYDMLAKYVSGSEKLYNQLTLEVLKDDEQIFKGKLSEFTGFTKRTLAESKEETLTFTVEFPPESGNEFQGLQTEMSFQFLTDTNDLLLGQTAMPSDHGSSLPQTGSLINPIIFYVGGLLLFVSGAILFFIKPTRLFSFVFGRGKGL